MADNIYSLLQQAWELAKTSDANIYGVEVAIVTNVNDPEKQGRVKVCFPRLPGKPEGDWARVLQPAAGSGRGFYWLPQVSDEVLVAFERGQSSTPFVIGSLWNGKDKPMQDAYADDNSMQMLQTKSGHRVVLSDKDGEEKIVVSDSTGKRTLTFDVKAKKLVIEGKEGDVEIHAKQKLVFACEDLEIKTGKSGEVKAGTSFDLKAGQKASIKAGPVMNLKASKVNLNPPSLSIADIAARVAAAAAAAARAAGAAGSGGGGGGASGGAGGMQARGGAGGAGPAGGGDLGSDVVPGGGKAGEPAEPGKAKAATDQSSAGEAVAQDEIDVQLVSVAGNAKGGVEVELTLSDSTKRAGKTDDKGHFKLSGLSARGKARLDVPDVEIAPESAPSVAGRLRFVKGGIDIEIGKASVVELPPRVRRCRLSGMNFETNKTFLLPQAMTGIRQLVKLYKSFEGIVGLVNGHTDKQPPKSGDAFEFNRKLSLERAQAVAAYLTDDADAWQKFYAGTGASGQWGVREDQMMLAALKDKDGSVFYEGEIDGKAGPGTKAAYHKFQRSRLLDEKDSATKEMRTELVRAYMQLDGTSLPKGSKLAFHGCGQTHPLKETEGDPNPDQPKNRRVEAYLFEEQVDPEPVEPEPRAGCEQHAKWVEKMVQDVDLDQAPGTLKVRVVDEKGQPVAGAHVHASGPLPLDADGADASFEDLIPGSYKVIANADGFLAADETREVPSGGSAEVTLTLGAETFDLDILVEDKASPPQKLEGANVSVDANGFDPQKTDKDGLAHFKKLPRGKLKVTAEHESFERGSIDLELPLKKQPADQEKKGLVGDGERAPAAKPPVVALDKKAAQPPFLRFEIARPKDGKPDERAPLQGSVQAFKGKDPAGPSLKFDDGNLPLADIPADATRIELTIASDSLTLFEKTKDQASNVKDQGHYVVIKPDGTLLVAGQFENGKLQLLQRPAADSKNPKANWTIRVQGFGERALDGPGFAKVKHFFVLMLENRSFDHLLGHNDKLAEADTIANFARRGEAAPTNTFAGTETATAGPGAPDLVLVDPGHEFDHCRHQLFKDDKVDPNDFTLVPKMDGFAEEYFKRLSGQEVLQDPDLHIDFKDDVAKKLKGKGVDAKKWAPQIMKGFTRDDAIVINTLAEQYAVCDRWFSPMPGPTCPTRLFIHGGSSAGLDDSPTRAQNVRFTELLGISFDGGNIFDKFKSNAAKGIVARAFVVGSSQIGLLKGSGSFTILDLADDNKRRGAFASHLRADEIKDKKGSYTFIEPFYGSFGKVATFDPTENFIDGSSQHPPGSMKAGDKFIKEVFDAIFGSGSPIRDSSALIITWDEHGGFYDHVPPPVAIQVTNTKEENLSKKKYKFGRYGVRLPAVIVSPFIPAGVVDHTIYDTTAVLRTLEKRFDLTTPLSKRDQLANDFAHLFTLDQPRPDFPSLPRVAVAEVVAAAVAADEPAAPISNEGHSFLAVPAIAAAQRMPERVPDIQRRLQEAKTVQDAVDLAADLEAAPAEVVVRVQDAAGKAVPGSNVKLTFATVHEGRTSDGTDGQEVGTVRFKGVVPGKYVATADHEGFQPLNLPVTARERPPAEAGVADAPAAAGGIFLDLKFTQPAGVRLTVQLKTVFALTGDPNRKERWQLQAQEPRATGMQGGALLRIDGGTPVTSGQDGKAVLDLSALSPGQHVLAVEPAAAKRSRGPGGPTNGPAGPDLATGKDTGPDADPDFMFRPFQITITTDAKGLTAVADPPARFSPGNPPVRLADHFGVLSFKANELVLDWKPDWMKSTHKQQMALPPTVLVLHHTGITSLISGHIKALVFGDVSAHYLVDADGYVIKIVHESNIAAHVGGRATWRGRSGAPNFSIGIEQAHGSGAYPPEQVFATTRLARAILDAKPTITRQGVTGHGDMEPTDQTRVFSDPGGEFNWQSLEDAGAARTRAGTPPPGPIYGLTGAPGEQPLRVGSRGPAVGELQQDLRNIGYPFDDPPDTSGRAPESVFRADDLANKQARTQSAVRRFQERHFTGPRRASRPRVGEVDFLTAQTIKQVLADTGTTVNSVNAAPTAPQPPAPGGDRAASDEADAVPADQTPGGPGPTVEVRPTGPVVHDGDEVEISWSVEGEFDRLILDPGGIDVTSATTRKGKTATGSFKAKAQRADAVDGSVPFTVTALHADAERTGEAAADGQGKIDELVAAGRKLVELTPLILGPATALHCIPARSDPNMTGTAFMKLVANVKSAADRDKEVLKQIRAGNVPDFLRNFIAVRVTEGKVKGVVFVAPDYLAIGTDADFVRVPLLPRNAQDAVDACCCTFPTARLCDEIFKAATTRIAAVSVPNNPGVQNGEVVASNDKIKAILGKVPGYQLGDLTTGPKKDIVLSLFLKRLDLKGKPIGTTGHVHQSDNAVVIYGWHDPKTGAVIQGEFDGHDVTYEDYSHGIRLVSNVMVVDDGTTESTTTMKDVRRSTEFRTLLCRPQEVKDPNFAPVFPYPDSYPASAKGPLSVRVIDAAQKDLAGVLVQVTGPEPADARTDAAGIASFPALLAGEYDIVATMEGFVPGHGKGKVSAPGGEAAGDKPDTRSPVLTLQANRIQVQLEEPGVKTEATEGARSWAENKAVVKTAAETGIGPSAQGVVDVPGDPSAAPTLVRVERVTGGGLANLHWRTVPAGGAALGPGARIALHTRLRNSIWTNTALLVGDVNGKRPKEADRIDQLATGMAMIDDISVVDTHFLSVEGDDLKLKHGQRFVRPETYVAFADGLHAKSVQLLGGAQILRGGESFVEWLRRAKTDAAAMDRFAATVKDALVASHFDGIGLDFEFPALAESDGPKIKQLLQAVARELQGVHKLLAVAGGNFGKDILQPPGFQKAQPPEIVKGFPNFIFRPMSYRFRAGANPEPLSTTKLRMQKGLEYMLVTQGMHPGQIQLAVNEGSDSAIAAESAAEMSDLCTTMMKPNRVGCIYWQLGVGAPPTSNLQAIENALNAGEAARGTPHQPLQAPLPDK